MEENNAENKNEQEGNTDNKDLSIVEKAENVLEGINKATEEFRKEKEGLQQARAQDLLGGSSSAGKEIKEEKKVETNSEYRARVTKEMAGGKTEW